MLGTRFRSAVQVDYQFGGLVQRSKLTLAHAVAASVVMEGVIRPSASKPETIQGSCDEGCRAGRTIVLRPFHQHRWSPGVGLDVVRLVAKPLESNKVVHRLPDDACDGNLRHHAEQDNLRAAHCAYASFAPKPRSSARSRSSRSASLNASAMLASASGFFDRSARNICRAFGESFASMGSTD